MSLLPRHRLAWPQRPPAATIFRIVVLVVCTVLTVAQGEGRAVGWLVAFASLTLVLSVTSYGRRLRTAAFTVEGALVGAAAVATGGSTSPLLPYLLAPSFHAGLELGLVEATLPASAAAASLVVGRFVVVVGDGARAYAGASAEWVLLAVAVGAVAAWSRRLLTETPPPVEQGGPYAAAYRLLSQLRTVARELSGGLDPAGLAHSLLNDVGGAIASEHAAVFVRSNGGQLLPLVHSGSDSVAWNATLAEDSPFSDAWMSQQPQLRQRSAATLRHLDTGPTVVLPLRIGMRTFGLVGIDATEPAALTMRDVARAQRTADEAALRLETALLFNEIREIATAEERRRLAREIHDSIAQDLASWGYLLDSLMATTKGTPVSGELRDLRKELTRIISEIRLSIFELRSDVDQYGGLGAALSEFIRSVGTGSPLTVHLSLDEGPTRLPPNVEAELLRIAQEAITNARKHANAENLWVHCVVDPPTAGLWVEDDGVGMQMGREDSYGLEIMRERAARLGATLSIAPRQPRGTVVEVVIDHPAVAESVHDIHARR